LNPALPNGTSPYTPPAHTPPDYKGAQYIPPKDETGEAAGIGRLIGLFIHYFYLLSIKYTMSSGATVLDVLRMRNGTADFFGWKRMRAVWLGLFGYLCLANGLVGALVGQLLALCGLMKPGGVAVFNGLQTLHLLVVNALYSIFLTPSIGPRLDLIRGTTSYGWVGDVLNGVKFASVSLLDWYSYLDFAAMLIPVGLTVAATVKYARLAKKKNFLGGDLCVGRPWTPAQKGLMAFALLLYVLGLPGAPAGLWVLIALLGWLYRGKTKNTGDLSLAPQPITSRATFKLAAAPEPPVPTSAAPRLSGTGSIPTLDTLSFDSPLREFEEAEPEAFPAVPGSTPSKRPLVGPERFDQ
jgi:hypothetical protein